MAVAAPPRLSELADLLLRRPPSLREQVVLVGNAEDHAWFVGLVRRLGVCPRIRSWRRKPPRNNLLTVIWTLSWSNQHLYTSLMTHIA